MNHNTKIMHVHNLQYSIINSTKECTLKDRALSFPTIYCKSHMYKASPAINPFAPADFAEKRVLKLVECFSGHCRAIKG